jgi:hypothetical protein
VADDIVAWLEARFRDLENAIETELETHAPLYTPAAQLLADIASKRAILAEVMSWQHDYIPEDSWYSCAQAVDSQDGEPGSGCGDDARANTGCDCGLDHRRDRFLRLLAQPYRGVDGWRDEWAID